ncbi:formate/nitrite transporter family protein [Candidatus Saccharibacteria bacterium]|nr:formate/nitrite transporter family protein [Candidatus Saccharibacteria bacterium]
MKKRSSEGETKRGTRSGELIRKSAGAAVLIGLGDYALLKLGNPIGPVIFALGLLGVCYMKQNLFTGKCGFLFEDKIKVSDLLIILSVNLLVGYGLGLIFSLMDGGIVESAIEKVGSWKMSGAFFLNSVMCGVVMYVAVKMYREGTPLGILFGIPLFIFCGFQHCIANVITMGVARGFSLTILVCAVGNFLGSVMMWAISREGKKK